MGVGLGIEGLLGSVHMGAFDNEALNTDHCQIVVRCACEKDGSNGKCQISKMAWTRNSFLVERCAASGQAVQAGRASEMCEKVFPELSIPVTFSIASSPVMFSHVS